MQICIEKQLTTYNSMLSVFTKKNRKNPLKIKFLEKMSKKNKRKKNIFNLYRSKNYQKIVPPNKNPKKPLALDSPGPRRRASSPAFPRCRWPPQNQQNWQRWGCHSRRTTTPSAGGRGRSRVRGGIPAAGKKCTFFSLSALIFGEEAVKRLDFSRRRRR
jgi:hypothetical protein